MNIKRIDLILVGIITGLLFYLYVMPSLKEKMASITGVPNIVKMDQNACSRSCCKHSQWPVPHMKNEDTEHIGTNLMCNNGDGGGCVCVTDSDLNYVSTRGENGINV